VLYTLGESPLVVMQEMGHRDPALALRVYAQAMRRDEHQQAQLRALLEGVSGEDWANEAQVDPSTGSVAVVESPRLHA
jgi:hypothetical protein